MANLYTNDTNPPKQPAAAPGQINLKKSEPHIMASFHENPEGVKFENQDDDEIILLFLRRHYITNLGWQLTTLFLFILPLLTFATFPYLNIDFTIPSQYILITVVFYYLIVIGYAFISFVVWFYNVGIVSNKRVVDIDVNGISSKDVAATNVADIVDISFKQSGLKQSLFDFGDVYMETEAMKPNFEFLNVPHPAKVTDLISKLMRGNQE